MLTLLSTGSNAQGQLGHGTIEDSNVFIPCLFASCPPGTLPKSTVSILNIVTGSNHTLVLLNTQHQENGSTTRTTEVWGSGDGSKGQLGPEFLQHQKDQNQSNSTIFQKLSLETTLEKLGFGSELGYTMSDIGTTWETSYIVFHHPTRHDVILSFGSDDFGDLGVGKLSNKNKSLGLQVVDYSHINVDGKPLHDASIVTVEKLRTGQRHIIVSLTVSWKNDDEPTQVLIGWGACRHGQLDTSTLSSSSTQPMVKPSQTPNKVTKSKSKMKQTKTKSQTEPTFHSQPILLMSTSNSENIVIEYSLGIQHSVFLHPSGRISYRGSNRKQQLEGLNNLQLRPIHDVRCTWNGTYIVAGNDPTNILSTGSNTHGQLGRSEIDPTIPIMSITKSKIKSMSCGSEHILVIITNERDEEEVWGWGWNEHGNLGIGNTQDSPSAVRIIPGKGQPMNHIGSHTPIHGVWGGTGTSWILCGISEF